eukprot:gene31000-23406_t
MRGALHREYTRKYALHPETFLGWAMRSLDNVSYAPLAPVIVVRNESDDHALRTPDLRPLSLYMEWAAAREWNWAGPAHPDLHFPGQPV